MAKVSSVFGKKSPVLDCLVKPPLKSRNENEHVLNNFYQNLSVTIWDFSKNVCKILIGADFLGKNLGTLFSLDMESNLKCLIYLQNIMNFKSTKLHLGGNWKTQVLNVRTTIVFLFSYHLNSKYIAVSSFSSFSDLVTISVHVDTLNEGVKDSSFDKFLSLALSWRADCGPIWDYNKISNSITE